MSEELQMIKAREILEAENDHGLSSIPGVEDKTQLIKNTTNADETSVNSKMTDLINNTSHNKYHNDMGCGRAVT